MVLHIFTEFHRVQQKRSSVMTVYSFYPEKVLCNPRYLMPKRTDFFRELVARIVLRRCSDGVPGSACRLAVGVLGNARRVSIGQLKHFGLIMTGSLENYHNFHL